LNVALIQFNTGQDKLQNIHHACALVESAAGEGAEFILLPEVFNYRGPLSGSDLYDKIAEDIPGESLTPLMEIAKKIGVNILAGSVYERAEEKNKVYNTSVVIDKFGSLICKYRKINLFHAVIDGKEIDEANTYEAGDKPVICEINSIKIGLSICFDLRFPELYRGYFNKGVNMIAVPSSFTKRTGRLHWEALLRARAIENYCYVLAPNQFGIDGNGVETYGHSMVIDPQGHVIDVLDKQEEGILMAELSFDNRIRYPSIN
jgi:predicted amidohydrolase